MSDPRDARYFEVLEGTQELIRQLEAFVRGETTREAMSSWAHELREKDGTHREPLGENKETIDILVNLYNATAKTRDGTYILRVEDAALYVGSLRRGHEVDLPLTLYLAGPSAPFGHYVERLRLPAERHIIPGVGWYDFLRFCSPATGRKFCLHVNLEDVTIEPEPKVPTFVAERDDSPEDCFIDLLETLAIDSSELAWIADNLKTIQLPTWTLWRQDDNGNKSQMQSFTGYRKARAELARFEALSHKQTYWLEGPALT